MITMKKDEKFVIVLLVLILIASTLCGCAKAVGVVEYERDEKGVIGYVIIPHYDGDEHAPITDYYYANGTITAYCEDGRKIVSTDITLVIN